MNERQTWRVTAGLAGFFCAAVAATLLYHHAHATANDPWQSPQLLKLQAELAASPKEERLKTEIRSLDLTFRQRFFRLRAMDRAGAWLLLGGGFLFLAAARRAAALRPAATVPPPASTLPEEVAAARARRAVAGTGVLLCAGLAAWGGFQQAPRVSQNAAAPKAPAAAALPDLPPHEEFLANWPRFRGPDGGGAALRATGPVAWDEAARKGVLWKTEIPSAGFNSPIVWGDRVFLSGATAEKREVFCFDARGGQLLWRQAVEKVQGSPAKAPEVPEQTGYAAPTLAADGRRVYAIFANGDLAALTFEGAPVWSKNLGVPKNQYGHATSLAYWRGRLIVQFDEEGETAGASRLMALDGATGAAVWEKPRKVSGSWASPIVVEAAGKTQILTAAVPALAAYAFADGAELWKAEVLAGEVTPSPVLAGGLVCVVNPSDKVLALKPDGAGDVTKTHVAWSYEDNVPDVASPVSNGECVFFVTSGGIMTCLDAKTGAKQWEHDFGTEIQASPGIAGDRLYVVATDGHAWVAEAGRAYKELGAGVLDDKFFASPAFAGGRLYLRGNARLYCLGEK
ncbi:MAG: PQQ-binding-like beta-propeller repeat protein [Chthoniobacteraceae bacterium]|nr:PQQ-binding-like beta-propeller repeat protein [Chthoniobacteraceae bacterium]